MFAKLSKVLMDDSEGVGKAYYVTYYDTKSSSENRS